MEANYSSAKVITTRMFLQELSALSELINDNNYMFFAPKERLTSTKLLDCYNKYQAWYRKLPAIMRIEGRQPEPHTITLQYVLPNTRSLVTADHQQYALLDCHCPPLPPNAQGRFYTLGRSPSRQVHRSRQQSLRAVQVISLDVRLPHSASRDPTYSPISRCRTPSLLQGQPNLSPKPCRKPAGLRGAPRLPLLRRKEFQDYIHSVQDMESAVARRVEKF